MNSPSLTLGADATGAPLSDPRRGRVSARARQTFAVVRADRKLAVPLAVLVSLVLFAIEHDGPGPALAKQAKKTPGT